MVVRKRKFIWGEFSLHVHVCGIGCFAKSVDTGTKIIKLFQE